MLKKKDQNKAEILAFNRLLVNYNIQFLFIHPETKQLVSTVLKQVRRHGGKTIRVLFLYS